MFFYHYYFIQGSNRTPTSSTDTYDLFLRNPNHLPVPWIVQGHVGSDQKMLFFMPLASRISKIPLSGSLSWVWKHHAPGRTYCYPTLVCELQHSARRIRTQVEKTNRLLGLGSFEAGKVPLSALDFMTSWGATVRSALGSGGPCELAQWGDIPWIGMCFFPPIFIQS